MQKIIAVIICQFLFIAAIAQQQSGTVIYDRYIRVSLGPKALPPNWKRYYIHRFELSFTPAAALYKSTNDPVLAQDEFGTRPFEHSEGDDLLSDITLFSDREKGITLEEGEFMGKRVLISDSIHLLPWKISNETKVIAGHTCQKAATERIELRRATKLTKKWMLINYLRTDTVDIVAWFTTEIPVNAGPDEFTGQLPGLILEMNIGKDAVRYIAQSIKPEVNKEKIKAPVKGKPMTAQEFAKYKDKILKETYERTERQFNAPGGKG